MSYEAYRPSYIYTQGRTQDFYSGKKRLTIIVCQKEYDCEKFFVLEGGGVDLNPQ